MPIHVTCFAALLLCATLFCRADVSPSERAALSNDCEVAASLAHAGRFVEAAGLLGTILSNPAHRAALAAPWSATGEPWLLFWSNCRLYWLQQADPGNVSVADEAWRLIHAYAAAAKCARDWQAYHWLYDRLFTFYRHTRNTGGLHRALEHRFLCMPHNPYYLMCVLHELPVVESAPLSNYVARYTAAGGQPFPELLLFRAQAAYNSGSDALTPALAVLAFAPHLSFHEVRAALQLARSALPRVPDDGVRHYHNALANALLAFPLHGEHAACAALLLAELQRLAAQPDVLSDPDARWLALRVEQYTADAPALAHARALVDGLASLERALAHDASPPSAALSFTNLLSLPAVPDMIYRHARQLVDQPDYARALPWFELLASPHNPDGFNRGNVYYFLAFLQDHWLADPVAAFTNYLKVQEFPACLVFTAGAYYNAALILERLGLPLHAEALLCVDVPTIDFDAMCEVRRLRAMRLCRARGDLTNAVRHLQTLCLAVPAASNLVADCLACDTEMQQAWPSLAASYAPGEETAQAFRAALSSTNATPDDVLFLEALTHDWPAMSELPAVIATNRLLNNNIFPPRR